MKELTILDTPELMIEEQKESLIKLEKLSLLMLATVLLQKPRLLFALTIDAIEDEAAWYAERSSKDSANIKLLWNSVSRLKNIRFKGKL